MTNRMFHVIVFMPVILTGILIYLIMLAFHEKEYDPCKISLIYENAPEQTAYLDILIKLSPEDENYQNFTRPPKYYTHRTDIRKTTLHYHSFPVDQNSRIAQYHEDEYCSLSLHYRHTDSLIVWNSEYNQDHLYEEQEAELNLDYQQPVSVSQIYQQYGSFRAAYVDESGNILQVTNISGIRYNNGSRPNALYADGKKLILELSEVSPLVIILSNLCQIGWIVYFIIILFLLIRHIIKEIRRKIRLIKSDQ